MKIGIIGGSGLDDPNILENPSDLEVDTPYGAPNSTLRQGKIGGKDVVLLARHGRSHTATPTNVNYRANIHALRMVGCAAVLSTTAVGSLRAEIGRGDLVILDQFIDFTRRRALTFHDRFEPHNPAHTPMADPFSEPLRELLVAACRKFGYRHHDKGTVVTIEGPRFSTRAESNMFRAWGADVINMSVATECALAVEAGLPYAAVAMSTDYDCWKTDEPPVSWDEIVTIFKENAEKVTSVLIEVVGKM
ncbi:S-methyl-5'-thioadenosine phosphorylase [Desulfovibrio aerotolerans]|uniref:Purine nucleoside phosphorylase n=1 Tax=Solidesulfovibrio aerotolerans TaxID=295255 RepID=A0A7C9MW04_9BACT|nr:S-methyl-5'-thioadenosine phosphorylase [Solidesulfovibrio aerotolerans]MYL84034.1 S-methyl-5'-thioadenosine phosphorylase [Solidesulfovibrio aerotolerans]